MKRVTSYVGTIALILFALTACTTTQTKLVEVWSDDAYAVSRDPLRIMLIIGMTETLEDRRMVERIFADAFSKNGVEAVPSLEIMSADTEIIKQMVEGAIMGTDIEAVLVTRLVRLEETELYHGPHPTTYRSEKQFRETLWDYQAYSYDYASDPNLKTKNRVAVLESSLYDVNTARLIWSVQSQSIDPKSADTVIRSLSALVVDSLKKENLI